MSGKMASLAEVLAGVSQMGPQEQNLYDHHLGNLYGGGKVTSPLGDISTLYQAVVPGPYGRFYNIPTVWDGQILTTQEAAEKAASKGWDNWPSYTTPDAADLAYEARVHPAAAQDVGRYNQTHDLVSLLAGFGR
jgi:hypothetical protein